MANIEEAKQTLTGWELLFTFVFAPIMLSAAIAFIAQFAKQLVKSPRDDFIRIFASSISAAVAALSSHLLLRELFPLTDNALIGISGIFGYLGADYVSRAIAKSLEARTGIKFEDSTKPPETGGKS